MALLTHEYCSFIVQHRRKSCKVMGWRLSPYVFLKQDGDDFVVFKLGSSIKYDNNSRQYTRVSISERDIVNPELFRITRHGEYKVCNAVYAYELGFRIYKTDRRQSNGYHFWTPKFGNITGAFPIFISNNGIRVSPEGIRTVDNEKRLEFNRKLKTIRNVFRVRAKLGVFNHFTKKHIEEYVRDKTFKDVLSIIDHINVENLDTFLPLFNEMFLYRYNFSRLSIADIDLVREFNLYINRMRETAKRALGVVTFVPRDQAEMSATIAGSNTDEAHNERESADSSVMVVLQAQHI